MYYSFIFFWLLQLSSSATLQTLDHRFIKSTPKLLHCNETQQQQYFELTHPLPSDLHPTPSRCSLLALRHDFADTLGRPPVSVTYSPPPDCAPPWSSVVLGFRASCKGEQYDRIAGVWLDGSEILRTSTAEPTESGVFWIVRKDVTRYSSLLAQSDLTLSVSLENIVNDVFTGVYHVNITFLYYPANTIRVPASSPSPPLPHYSNLINELGFVGNRETNSKLGLEDETIGRPRDDQKITDLYKRPADLIIPISRTSGDEIWFRIQGENDVHSKGIQIPSNTFRAMLEIYVSFHGNDEFWYSNPPDSYIKMNNLTTERGHGAYREVLVTIDGNLVGSVIPFPVIFTGGINPLFWEPVVSIGAFDLPSYDLELTPFLGLLLDGKIHSFGLGVADGIQFWLVDANLHLWLDHGSSKIIAKTIDYSSPAADTTRKSIFNHLDGSFMVESKRTNRFSGWVNSTAGNFTTHVGQKLHFKNSIEFSKKGTHKSVEQRVKTEIQVKVESDKGSLISQSVIKRKHPLRITMWTTLPEEGDDDRFMMVTNVSHGLKEEKEGRRVVENRQECNGWMVVEDHSVVSGSATNRQVYRYRDEKGWCYWESVEAADGVVVSDSKSFSCSSSSSS